MSLTPGGHLGAYAVVIRIGAGGMGEVWRALARFKREALVLASLNHPNIGGTYDLEDSRGGS